MNNSSTFRESPLEKAAKKKLFAFKHDGFGNVDTKRDKDNLDFYLKIERSNFKLKNNILVTGGRVS